MSEEDSVLDGDAIEAGIESLTLFAANKRGNKIAEGVVAKIMSSFDTLAGCTSEEAHNIVEQTIAEFCEQAKEDTDFPHPLLMAGYYAEALRGALNAATGTMGMDNIKGSRGL